MDAKGLSPEITAELRGIRISKKLIDTHIEPSPHTPGASGYWIKDLCLPIWSLIAQAQNPGMTLEEHRPVPKIVPVWL